MDFFERLEEARNRWNVLSHPFYERWESGELGEDELAYYAGEYRHAVVALAQTAAQAATADPELREHAEEEAAHVALWDTFAWTAGADAGRPARAEKAEPDDEERLLVAASGALAGNWTLLDGVQHAFSVR